MPIHLLSGISSFVEGFTALITNPLFSVIALAFSVLLLWVFIFSNRLQGLESMVARILEKQGLQNEMIKVIAYYYKEGKERPFQMRLDSIRKETAGPMTVRLKGSSETVTLPEHYDSTAIDALLRQVKTIA